MGLLDLFKKEKNVVTFPLSIKATANGDIVAMKDIPDAVFAQGMVGPCIGIEPSNGTIVAPCDGKILQLSDTLHAFGIEGIGGVQILVHIGIDTVRTYLNTEHLFTKTYRPVQDIKVLNHIKQFEEAVINKEPMSMKDLNISGTTVKNMVSELSDTGVVLNALLEEVLHNPSLNNEEYLINRTKEIIETLESKREDFDRE